MIGAALGPNESLEPQWPRLQPAVVIEESRSRQVEFDGTTAHTARDDVHDIFGGGQIARERRSSDPLVEGDAASTFGRTSHKAPLTSAAR